MGSDTGVVGVIKDEQLSIVIPAKNEAESLATLLDQLKTRHADAEIIVVNDGSEDATLDICQAAGVMVVNHPNSKGNGAAIKSGARRASRPWILFMDADGQHRPGDIPGLLEAADKGFDLVVGSRNKEGHANVGRWVVNVLYNKFASLVTGQKITDLTSGFRLARRSVFLDYLYLLPNGFSYPTTSTMAFLREGFSVAFVPIECLKRLGSSHIRPLKDGMRFLIIIMKVATLFSPLMVFLPIAITFLLIGLGYSGWTLLDQGRFTNMGALVLSMGFVIFLMGIISEQITVLMYRRDRTDEQDSE